MNKSKSSERSEYLNFEDIASAIREELDDARDEHERLSTVLMRKYEDDDAYILEDYLDDLQEYIDEMENLTDSFENMMDIRERLTGDMKELKSKFKRFGLS